MDLYLAESVMDWMDWTYLLHIQFSVFEHYNEYT